VHDPVELRGVGLVPAGRVVAVAPSGGGGQGGELEATVVTLAPGGGVERDAVTPRAQLTHLLGDHHLETPGVRLTDGEPRRADHCDVESLLVTGVHGPPLVSSPRGGCW